MAKATVVMARATVVMATATVVAAAVGMAVPTGVVGAERAVPAAVEAVPVNPGTDVSGGEAVPGEYVVMLRADPVGSPTRADATGRDLSARIGTVISRLNQAVGRTAGAADGGEADGRAGAVDQDSLIAELPVIDGFGVRLSPVEAAVLSSFDDVLSVVPNTRFQAIEVPSMSTSGAASAQPVELPWGLDRIDQRDLPLDGSYRPPRHGSGVTAYVIDTGVWGRHQELAGRTIEPAIDFSGENADPECMVHGTHVAGTIVGKNVGVAPQARVQSIRVVGCIGDSTALAVLQGMDWVAEHAQLPAVANISLAGLRGAAYDMAVEYMTAKGVTVVVAAGNDTGDACSVSPAAAPSAITVAATDSYDRPAGFSNFGSCVDVYAPGVDVLSASVGEVDLYERISGTSQASPHGAGTAAVYLAAHPTATPDAVQRAIVAGAASDVLSNVPVDTPNKLLQVNGLPKPVERPNTDPVAHITPPAETGAVSVGVPLKLDGRASIDPGGGTLTYEWRVQGREGVVGTKPTVTITPNGVGLFVVTLKVTNAAAVSSTAALWFETRDPKPPVIGLDPAGDILATAGTTLSWDASGSVDRHGGELSYDWYYETIDYEVIHQSGPTFQATFSGGLEVLTVEATNRYGTTSTKRVTISEPSGLVAVIDPSSAEVSVGDEVVFDASQTYDDDGVGGYFEYQWRNDPDGDVVGTDSTYVRSFNKVGTYDVWLTVLSGSDERSTAKATVVVTERVAPPGPATLSAVEPERVLDTRLSSFGVPGPKGVVAARGVIEFVLPDVPDFAAGVVMNVTAVHPSGDGHLTVYPCGDRPGTSNVNYRAGVTNANAVVSVIGRQREVCVWSFAATDVVVDVTGYVRARSAAHSIDPVRAIDTRSTVGRDGGAGGGAGRLAAGGVVRVPVSSVAKVPADASAVFVNVTAANPSADGHLTVYPCGVLPGTSNVNYRAGETKANMAVVRLAGNGSLCVKSHAETDVVVDVLGYVEADGGLRLTSVRKLDTRRAPLAEAADRVAGGSMVKIDLGVDPGKVDGVFLNVAAVDPGGDGHVTVFPCGQPPTASVLNYRVGVTTSNMVFSKVDSSGSVCVSTFATTDLVVDYNGAVATAT